MSVEAEPTTVSTVSADTAPQTLGGPRVVLVGDRRSSDGEGLVRDLEAAPSRVVARAWYGDESLHAIERHIPDAIVVDLAPSIDASIQTLRHVATAWPDLPVLVLPPEGGELAARALVVSDHIEIVARPLRPWTIASALSRLVPNGAYSEPTTQRVASPARGRIIAVIGSKGGVGTTTFAVNLAVQMKLSSGKRVSIVDLNIEQGDVALATDLISPRSITDLIREGDRLSPELVSSYLVEHGSGIRVLPAPPRPTGAIVDPSAARRVIGAVAATSDYAIVDLPRGLAPLQRTALQSADWVLVVVSNDVASLKNARFLIDAIGDLEKGPNQCHVVVNRVTERGGLDLGDCERALGRRALAELPYDDQLQASWTEGQPITQIATKSPYSRALTELATTFAHPTTRRPATGGGTLSKMGGLLKRKRETTVEDGAWL